VTLYEFKDMVVAFIKNKYNYYVAWVTSGAPDGDLMFVMQYVQNTLAVMGEGVFKYGSVQYLNGQPQITANMRKAVTEANLRLVVWRSNAFGKGVPLGFKTLLDTYQIPALYTTNQYYQSAVTPPPESFYFGSFGSVAAAPASNQSMQQSSMGTSMGMASTTTAMPSDMGGGRMSRISAAMGGIPGRIVGPGFTYPALQTQSGEQFSPSMMNLFAPVTPSLASGQTSGEASEGFMIPGDEEVPEVPPAEIEPLAPPSTFLAESEITPGSPMAEETSLESTMESPTVSGPSMVMDIDRLSWFPGIESY